MDADQVRAGILSRIAFIQSKIDGNADYLAGLREEITRLEAAHAALAGIEFELHQPVKARRGRKPKSAAAAGNSAGDQAPRRRGRPRKIVSE